MQTSIWNVVSIFLAWLLLQIAILSFVNEYSELHMSIYYVLLRAFHFCILCSTFYGAKFTK